MSVSGVIVSFIKRFNCVSNTHNINQMKIDMKETKTQLDTLNEQCIRKDHFEHYKDMHYQHITHMKESINDRIDDIKTRMGELLVKHDNISDITHEHDIELACVKTMIGFLDQLKTKYSRK
jgi:hypothetical protein